MDKKSTDQYYAYNSTTGGSNNGGTGGMGCGGTLIVFIVAILIIAFIFSNTGNTNKSRTSSSYSRNTGTKRVCLVKGCDSTRQDGSFYCYKHTCSKSDCDERVADGSIYCSKHKPQQTTTSPSTAKKNKNKSTEKKDPYNIGQYSDVDDFYEDWYDDFDGFDDAEMYWDEMH